jgi:uncharacterized protein (DUF3820 family)
MTEINLEDFTKFSKIKDCWNNCFHDKNGLHEFLNNVVMNMDYGNGYGRMLPDLSDIYVLVSKKDFPFEKLTSNQEISVDLSAAKQNFILGYIWLCPWVLQNEGCIPYHFINFIDSRISGLNISNYMIKKYEEQTEEEIYLFPFEVMSGAKYYWKKYFIKEYGIKNKIELLQMICEYKLKKSDIRWDELMSAFEM